MDKFELSSAIKKRASELNCSGCGISSVKDNSLDMTYLNKWIAKGYHANMEWITKNHSLRNDPNLLLPDVKSIVMITVNYFSESNSKSKYKVSKYAQNMDYHWVLRSKLKNILEFVTEIDDSIVGKIFVDSGPFFEKSYAVNAGLGWIGKNGLLILPKKGSFHFIGTLLLNKELAEDTPYTQNHCGNCNKCIDTCPTNAIVAPGVLNANKCISYLTIEHKGEIPPEIDFRDTNLIFGCDICQSVCPYNRFPSESTEETLIPSQIIRSMTDASWEEMTKSEFKKIFKYSPLQRAGYEKLKSNIEYIKNPNS